MSVDLGTVVALLIAAFAAGMLAEAAWAYWERRRQAAATAAFQARYGEIERAAEQFSAAVGEALGPVMVQLADAFSDFGRTYAQTMTDVAEKLAEHEQDRRDDLLDQR